MNDHERLALNLIAWAIDEYAVAVPPDRLSAELHRLLDVALSGSQRKRAPAGSSPEPNARTSWRLSPDIQTNCITPKQLR